MRARRRRPVDRVDSPGTQAHTGAVFVMRHGGAPVTLIVERRSEHQSTCVEGVQQFVGPEYAKVEVKPIHRQEDNGDLSLGDESKAKKRAREPIWA
jgi:hypothetical protein